MNADTAHNASRWEHQARDREEAGGEPGDAEGASGAPASDPASGATDADVTGPGGTGGSTTRRRDGGIDIDTGSVVISVIRDNRVDAKDVADALVAFVVERSKVPLERNIENLGWITAVERCWRQASTLHPELPTCRVAIGSPRRSAGHTLGAWTASESRLWLSPVLEQEGAERVLGVVLHEAAHALGAARDLQDTSRRGYYHNAVFMGLAAEIGLCPSDDSASSTRPAELGWDRPAPATLVAYRSQLAALRRAEPR